MPAVQQLECRVYFEDTDAGGVVYYANYLKFYERGRSEYLRNLGFEQDQLLEQQVVFVVRQITVDYKQAARFNEVLRVETSVKQLKRVSVLFDQKIYCRRGEENVLINQAEVNVVCVHSERFKAQSIPESIVRKLSDNE